MSNIEVFTVAGVTYVVRAEWTSISGGGFPETQSVTLEGITYYWNAAMGLWGTHEDGRWRTVQHIRWAGGPIMPMYPFGIIDSDPVKGKPIHVWDHIAAQSGSVATNSSIASYHLDAKRWLRVTVLLSSFDGFVEIPLLDADDKPWLSPERPWNVIARWASSSTADHVVNPNVNDVQWADAMVSVRAGANIGRENYNYSVEWSLHPAQNPVPHWVLRVSLTGQGSTIFIGMRTVIVDIIGTGFGQHASASREQLASGSNPHWMQRLMWTQQNFNTVPNRTAFNQKKYGVGVIHVPNTAGSPTASVLYLTTGVNEGTTTGTALFTDIPVVQVFGHAVSNVDVSNNVSTNWSPSSWGMGIVAPNGAATGSGATADPSKGRCYYSSIYKHGASGHYRVDIYNTGWNALPPPTSNSVFDRTFFVYALGK